MSSQSRTSHMWNPGDGRDVEMVDIERVVVRENMGADMCRREDEKKDDQPSHHD